MLIIGATWDELEVLLKGVIPHQSGSARCAELRPWGHVRYWLDKDGRPTRRLTRKNRPAHVLIATRKGVNAVELGFPIVKPGHASHDTTAKFHGGNPASVEAGKRGEPAHSIQRLIILQRILLRTPPDLIDGLESDPPKPKPVSPAGSYFRR